MKRFLLILMVSVLTLSVNAQESRIPVQQHSPETGVKYRLFSTRNNFNFLKLDTSTGKIWIVQWSVEDGKTFENVLNAYSMLRPSEEEKNGRFHLYPTTNIWTFLLLDQEEGRTWHVQWNIDRDKIGVWRIY